jgi:hypothetical protein
VLGKLSRSRLQPVEWLPEGSTPVNLSPDLLAITTPLGEGTVNEFWERIERIGACTRRFPFNPFSKSVDSLLWSASGCGGL